MSFKINKIKLNLSSTPSFLVFFTTVLSLFILLSPLTILAADPVVTTLDGGTSATADSGCSWSSGSGKGKYCLLAPISGFEGVSDGKLDIAGGGIEVYLQNLYKFGVYIAIGLAVMMIVIGGMQYVSTDAITGKDDGKKRITSALQGLILALMAYLILQVVNPELLKTSNLKPKTDVSLSGDLGTNPGTFGQSGLTPVTSTTNPGSNSSAKPTIEGRDYGDASINTSITNLNNYESQIKAIQEQAKTANDAQKAQLELQKQELDTKIGTEITNITSKNSGTVSRTTSGEWIYTKTTTSGGTTSGGSGSTGGSGGSGLPSGNGDVTQTTNPLLPPIN
jgi:hypothetical protein